MRTHPDIMYVFCIDTNKYAGTFERQLCAYLIGEVGECGVGHTTASVAKSDIPADLSEEISRISLWLPDDRGCWRPVGIAPTNGYFNDGYGGHYPNKRWGDPAIEKAAKERILEEGLHHLDGPNHWIYKASIREAKELEVARHPAYQTVEIYFNALPSTALVNLMRMRTTQYFKELNGLTKLSERTFPLQYRLITRALNEGQLFCWSWDGTPIRESDELADLHLEEQSQLEQGEDNA